MSALSEILLVASGGAVGCVGRYAADSIAMFPDKNCNTIAINITGCLLIGILWSLSDRTSLIPAGAYRLLVTGLLGGFTTFSAFSLHPVLMMRNGLFGEAALYVLVTVIGGLAACYAGMMATERLLH